MCPKSFLEHLQAFIYFKEQSRYADVKRIFNDNTIKIKIVGRDHGASNYGRKNHTKLEGPLTFGVRPALDPKSTIKSLTVGELKNVT